MAVWIRPLRTWMSWRLALDMTENPRELRLLNFAVAGLVACSAARQAATSFGEAGQIVGPGRGQRADGLGPVDGAKRLSPRQPAHQIRVDRPAADHAGGGGVQIGHISEGLVAGAEGQPVLAG